MKKNYYTPLLRFHRLRLNVAIQAASLSESRLTNGGSNGGGGGYFVIESKGYSSYDFDDEDEE